MKGDGHEIMRFSFRRLRQGRKGGQIVLFIITIKRANSIGIITWFTHKLKPLRKGLPVISYRISEFMMRTFPLKAVICKKMYNIINILLKYVIVY